MLVYQRVRPGPFGKGPFQRWKWGHRGPSCLHRFDFQPLRPAVWPAAQRWQLKWLLYSKVGWRLNSFMAMDQYLLIPFLVGWTSIYQLFWCSPGVQGFDTLPYKHQSRNGFTNLRMFAIVSSKSILQGPVPMCLRSLICDVVEPGVELNAAPRDIAASSKYSHDSHCKQKHKQWIGLRDLQETTLRIDVFQREWWTAGANCYSMIPWIKRSRDGWNMQWQGVDACRNQPKSADGSKYEWFKIRSSYFCTNADCNIFC